MSISEILVILLVALFIIKPEQLPEVAYTLGRVIKGMQGFFNKLKQEMHEFMTPFDHTKHE